MKKIFALILTLAMVLSFAACTATGGSSTGNDSATDASKTGDSDLAYVQGRGKLIVGVTVYEPMNYQNDDGSWTGFDTEFAQAFCEKIGVDAEFQIINWDNKIFELDSKAIDCIWNGMTILDEITKNASVSKPYVKNAQVVVMSSAKAASYKDLASMSKLKFAAEAGSAGEGILKEASYEYTKVEDQAAALLEVNSGAADACVIDITMANNMTGAGTSYSGLGIACELNAEEYGVAFRTGSDLTEKFNSVMADMMADGTLDTLAAKYKLTLVK